jgi:hypothetical protein
VERLAQTSTPALSGNTKKQYKTTMGENNEGKSRRKSWTCKNLVLSTVTKRGFNDNGNKGTTRQEKQKLTQSASKKKTKEYSNKWLSPWYNFFKPLRYNLEEYNDNYTTNIYGHKIQNLQLLRNPTAKHTNKLKLLILSHY